MTLCITAQSTFKNCDRIILASDFASETRDFSAEIQDKLAIMCDGQLPILMAGTMSRAMELVNRYERCFSKTPWQGAAEAFDLVKRPVVEQKLAIANEYVGTRLGISYTEFLEHGKARLPDGIYREMVYDIGRLTLDCSLIVVVYPFLFRVHEEGLVEPCVNFCAIGSGATVAEASLFHRQHSGETPFPKAMYHVFEAMRLGSKAPGVGKKLAVSVFYPSGKKYAMEQMDLSYCDYLLQQFDLYGPREVGHLEVRKDFLRPFGKTKVEAMAKKAGR